MVELETSKKAEENFSGIKSSGLPSSARVLSLIS